jgi:hypothetical protein
VLLEFETAIPRPHQRIEATILSLQCPATPQSSQPVAVRVLSIGTKVPYAKGTAVARIPTRLGRS